MKDFLLNLFKPKQKRINFKDTEIRVRDSQSRLKCYISLQHILDFIKIEREMYFEHEMYWKKDAERQDKLKSKQKRTRKISKKTGRR